MKELNLKQMESVNGGLESDCKGALVSLGMGVQELCCRLLH